MASRHYHERQPEYFIPGEGISREVIQADICRYLGNDAVVRPGSLNGRNGYYLRAYRNLTSEMIADLRSDSARWEEEIRRRAEEGHSRAPYDQSYIHESRQQEGPSPPQSYNTAPGQFMDTTYGQNFYGIQNPSYPASTMAAYTTPTSYPTTQSGYQTTTMQYSQPPSQYTQAPSSHTYPLSGQPVVSSPDPHPSYIHTTAQSGYSYDPRTTAPRYAPPGYESSEPDYSPGQSTQVYPVPTTTSAPMSADPRYASETTYSTEHRQPTTRTQQTGQRETHRRAR